MKTNNIALITLSLLIGGGCGPLEIPEGAIKVDLDAQYTAPGATSTPITPDGTYGDTDNDNSSPGVGNSGGQNKACAGKSYLGYWKNYSNWNTSFGLEFNYDCTVYSPVCGAEYRIVETSSTRFILTVDVDPLNTDGCFPQGEYTCDWGTDYNTLNLTCDVWGKRRSFYYVSDSF